MVSHLLRERSKVCFAGFTQLKGKEVPEISCYKIKFLGWLFSFVLASKCCSCA